MPNRNELNSPRPSDAMWRQRFGSTLVKAIDCCHHQPGSISSEINFATDTSGISPREPHALALGPSYFHTKKFLVERARLKTGKKLPIPCKFCTHRFIRYFSTCYGKFRIDPPMANIRNPDCFASPVANATRFVVVRPCYLNRNVLSGPKGNWQDRFQVRFLRNWPVRATQPSFTNCF